MSFRVVIPARWSSSRLPGKPLLELAGRPLLLWVLQVARDSGAAQVVVATDDARIEAAAAAAGAEVCVTRADHPSGTDRIAEVAARLGWPDDAIVVNLQGDEPLLPPALVVRAVDALRGDADAGVATLAVPVASARDARDPNVVKVVRDAGGHALYFSRAPIPFARDDADRHDGMLRHIGLYAYRVAALRRIAALPAAALEDIEKLEQLRPLWHGIRIAVAVVDVAPPPGVDTADDLERVRRLLAG